MLVKVATVTNIIVNIIHGRFKSEQCSHVLFLELLIAYGMNWPDTRSRSSSWCFRIANSQIHAALQWRHIERDGVSNQRRLDCLLNRCSSADQRKHQSSESLAIVRGIHRSPVNYPHKGPVRRNMFPYGDVIMRIRLVLDWCNTEYPSILVKHWSSLKFIYEWMPYCTT